MQTYVDEGLTIIVLTNTDGAAHRLETAVANILAPRGNHEVCCRDSFDAGRVGAF